MEFYNIIGIVVLLSIVVLVRWRNRGVQPRIASINKTFGSEDDEAATMNDTGMAGIEQRLDQLDTRLREFELWATQVHGYQAPVLPAPPAQQGSVSEQPGQVPDAAQQTGTASLAAVTFQQAPVANGQVQSVTPDTSTNDGSIADVEPPEANAPLTPITAPDRQVTLPAIRWSFSDFEQLLSGRGLAWIGGLAILIGALFFLGLAFTREWIGPASRVTIGLVAGGLLFTGGAWFFERREALFGHVLVAVGLGTISLSLVAATRLYELVPVEAGLVAALLIAIAAGMIAIRANTQVVAGYGLVTALAAPPLLGADPTLATIGFLAAALIGTTLISLYRSWGWLSGIAFLLSAPQLWVWLDGGAPLAVGMGALAGFGILNLIAAGGEEFRTRRQELGPTSATLLLGNAAFLVAAGFALLQFHDAEAGRGLFLVVTAFTHALIGGYFLYKEGDRHPFGLLAFGTGIAALTMAIPIQLGGPVVAIAWAAKAAALAWVYARRNHIYSGAVAAILGSLSVGHLLAFEYPVSRLGSDLESTVPFWSAAGGTLGFILLALAVAGYFVRPRAVRIVLTNIGFMLAIYALPFETSGLALLAGWAMLFVLAIAVDRSAGRPALSLPDIGALRGLLVPGVISGALALAHVLAVELPPDKIGDLPVTPFVDGRTAAAGILIAAGLLGGLLAGSLPARRISVIAAFAIAGYLMPFELPAAAVVVAWSLLALALCVIGRRDQAGADAYLGAGAALIGAALLVVFGVVAPPERLFVDATAAINHPPFWSGATAALGAIIVVLVVAFRMYRSQRQARHAAVLAGVLLVYLLSVEVVDMFQGRVGGGTALESLQKQAQVALSILWAALGGGTFVAGVTRWNAALRVFGLALLALATTKVFLYDLASLDATYKVLSFVGLGILLLASSYTYQRLKPQIAGPNEH